LSRARVAIVGAAGYTGSELARILLSHVGAEIVGLFGSARRDEDQTLFHELHPQFFGRLELPVQGGDPDRIAALSPDIVFLATPHEASVTLARDLLERGLRVIDLSGAYRLRDASLYPTYYGFEHEAEDLLERAVYGLPELNREAIRGAQLVAAPGCYPTSVIIPVHALKRGGLLRPGARVLADSVSGVSGAGRSLKQGNLFCEVSHRPYGVLTHRHQPEMIAHSGADVLFTPHLGTFERGIVSTIHADLAEGVTCQNVRDALDSAYKDEPFVRLRDQGDWPSVAGVAGTNYCDIGWAVDNVLVASGGSSHLIVFSAIDNLVKGASGQGVQCMNLMLGFEEGAALLEPGATRSVEGAGV